MFRYFFYIILKFLKRMQLHVILKLKLKLSAQNKYKFKIWILELIKSFVSGSSRDESQLVGNVSEDVVTKSIIINLFIRSNDSVMVSTFSKDMLSYCLFPNRLILVLVLFILVQVTLGMLGWIFLCLLFFALRTFYLC